MAKGVLRPSQITYRDPSQISHRDPSQIDEMPSQKCQATAEDMSWTSSTPHCSESSQKSSVFRQWFALGVGCLDHHACCSWSSFLTLRHSIATYLTAMGCVFLEGALKGALEGGAEGRSEGTSEGALVAALKGGAGRGFEGLEELNNELGRSALLHCLSMFIGDRLTIQGIAYHPSPPLPLAIPPIRILPSPVSLSPPIRSPSLVPSPPQELPPLMTQPILPGGSARAYTVVAVPLQLTEVLKAILPPPTEIPTLTTTVAAAATVTATLSNHPSNFNVNDFHPHFHHLNHHSNHQSSPTPVRSMFFCCLSDEEALLCATVLVKLLPVTNVVSEKSKAKVETMTGSEREMRRGTGMTKKRGREGDIKMDEELTRRDERMKHESMIDATKRDEIMQCVENLLSPIINRQTDPQVNEQSNQQYPQDNDQHRLAENNHCVGVNNNKNSTKQKQKKQGNSTKTKAVRLLARLRAN